MRPAVFLDRDGTIIQHVHHLTDPEDVRLIPGAAEAIAQLQHSGYCCVVITNQSVLGRGLIDGPGLAAVHAEVDRQLDEAGVRLDGWYYCPHVPTVDDPTVIEHPDRKPGPGMLQQAAQELQLDLANSWMVGDTISDVLAGENAGCRGSVLLTGSGQAGRFATSEEGSWHRATDLPAAVPLILIGR